jgi:hypothetical protein
MIDGPTDDTSDVGDLSAADRAAFVRAKSDEAEALDAEAVAATDPAEVTRLTALAGQARAIAEIHGKLLILEGAVAEES